MGIQPGATNSDANVEFPVPPAPFPYGSGRSLTGGILTGFGSTNWIYALGDGDYNATKVTVSSGGNPMLVYGDVRLYVTTDFTVSGSGYVYLAPGASAGEYTQKKKVARRQKSRAYAVEQGSTPEEIARYFALYGGYIDPYINKQSPGGPFDSGFFFDSGIGPNGGDSPYMN